MIRWDVNRQSVLCVLYRMCGERSLSQVWNGQSDRQYVLSTYCGVTIGYAIDVNWTNTPQISKANESNFVNYKDSYIILMNGTRYIRHDVIFELYQNRPTILKVEPTDCNPSDPKQDSYYTNEEYLEEQLSEPMRDHTYISEYLYKCVVNRCWRWNLNIGNRETGNMYSVYSVQYV